MPDEDRVPEEGFDARRLVREVESADFLVGVDLSKGSATREQTEEKRRLRVERLLFSEDEAEWGEAFLMLRMSSSIISSVKNIIGRLSLIELISA